MYCDMAISPTDWFQRFYTDPRIVRWRRTPRLKGVIRRRKFQRLWIQLYPVHGEFAQSARVTTLLQSRDDFTGLGQGRLGERHSRGNMHQKRPGHSFVTGVPVNASIVLKLDVDSTRYTNDFTLNSG